MISGELRGKYIFATQFFSVLLAIFISIAFLLFEYNFIKHLREKRKVARPTVEKVKPSAKNYRFNKTISAGNLNALVTHLFYRGKESFGKVTDHDKFPLLVKLQYYKNLIKNLKDTCTWLLKEILTSMYYKTSKCMRYFKIR